MRHPATTGLDKLGRAAPFGAPYLGSWRQGITDSSAVAWYGGRQAAFGGRMRLLLRLLIGDQRVQRRPVSVATSQGSESVYRSLTPQATL